MPREKKGKSYRNLFHLELIDKEELPNFREIKDLFRLQKSVGKDYKKQLITLTLWTVDESETYTLKQFLLYHTGKLLSIPGLNITFRIVHRLEHGLCISKGYNNVNLGLITVFLYGLVETAEVYLFHFHLQSMSYQGLP
eukprot:Pgem_evm1s11704